MQYTGTSVMGPSPENLADSAEFRSEGLVPAGQTPPVGTRLTTRSYSSEGFVKAGGHATLLPPNGSEGEWTQSPGLITPGPLSRHAMGRTAEVNFTNSSVPGGHSLAVATRSVTVA
ncbi:MAG: hypothetical protein QOK20_1115 [Acidimicrobiaceae bacterium]|jgi:hypothetical protein|nr:hypothetical protein [Acidimicrobiaceae bacterium]